MRRRLNGFCGLELIGGLRRCACQCRHTSHTPSASVGWQPSLSTVYPVPTKPYMYIRKRYPLRPKHYQVAPDLFKLCTRPRVSSNYLFEPLGSIS
eukprot:2242059-Prymnesium_polylepis.1